jgi:hypothetical protein
MSSQTKEQAPTPSALVSFQHLYHIIRQPDQQQCPTTISDLTAASLCPFHLNDDNITYRACALM